MPLHPAYNFSATNRSTCISHCLGAVPPPLTKKIWRLKIYVKTRKFPSTAELHTIVLSRPFTGCHAICIQISRGIKADNVCFEIFIVDPTKYLAGKTPKCRRKTVNWKCITSKRFHILTNE